MPLFIVGGLTEVNRRNQFYLVSDNWDDFGYLTSFILSYCDKDGEVTHIGGVKIGYRGQSERPDSTFKKIPKHFDQLEDDFFSLGTDFSYYQEIKEAYPDPVREALLKSLNDVAFNTSLI